MRDHTPFAILFKPRHLVQNVFHPPVNGDATRLKLGFNCIDHSHKRKLDEFLSAVSEDEGKCAESEDDEGSGERDDKKSECDM